MLWILLMFYLFFKANLEEFTGIYFRLYNCYLG